MERPEFFNFDEMDDNESLEVWNFEKKRKSGEI